jgi:hypothetical protein
MSYDVLLSVIFHCDNNDGIAQIAKRTLYVMNKGETDRDAIHFLEDVSKRIGQNDGMKGGLLTWGTITNHGNGEDFVKALMPFFEDILIHTIDGGPLWFQHIMIFVEEEQCGRATAYEVFRWERSDKTPIVEYQKHECPFTWMVY